MRILIAGAGAIGAYLGAGLTRAGAEVVLFARGPHLRAMQERGLRVVSPDGDFEVRPQVSGDLSSVGAVDVIACSCTTGAGGCPAGFPCSVGCYTWGTGAWNGVCKMQLEAVERNQP